MCLHFGERTPIQDSPGSICFTNVIESGSGIVFTSHLVAGSYCCVTENLNEN